MRGGSQLLLFLFCCTSFPGFAQQGAAPETVTPPAGAGRSMTLDVVVTDHAGNPVPGLQEQDFTLLDNKQPRTLRSFRAVVETTQPPDPPLQAIVLVDAVNATFQSAAYQREQLSSFLRQGGGELPLPMSLHVLPDTAGGPTAPTQDGLLLAKSLDSAQAGLRNIPRSTGFYGGVERAQLSISTLEHFAAYESTQPGRKSLIWLGPGWPLLTGVNVQLSTKDQNALFQTIVALSTALREARVTLYNIDATESVGRANYYEAFLKGVTSASRVQNGDVALQVFAVQSGGEVLERTDISKAISMCVADTKAYYILTFDPPQSLYPNEYHDLRVKIDGHGLTARTRTGYYAQP